MAPDFAPPTPILEMLHPVSQHGGGKAEQRLIDPSQNSRK